MATASIFVLLIASFAAATVSAAPGMTATDVQPSVKDLILNIREVVMHAKEGTSLDGLHDDMLALRDQASNLLSALPDQVSEAETQAVIKLAAAATGSHSVLSLFLAQDELQVLDGRLALGLALLENVAQQLEDESSLPEGDLGPYLAAVVFTTEASVDIINSADKAVKMAAASDVTAEGKGENRVRRQLKTSVNLGRGWSVGLGGVNWQSSSGRYSFNAKPTFSGFRPSGGQATFRIRF